MLYYTRKSLLRSYVKAFKHNDYGLMRVIATRVYFSPHTTLIARG